uniref:Peptidase A1 domain-containing protein n=1 Tax=Steinernema glaseri TaxID=37863 RepID=A0A1I7ZEY7_9BILA
MRNTIDAVLALVLIFVASAHSLTKVPYLVHPSITLDSNQKNALLNAILDLNMRTCLKFVPRKRQRDYILFTDLGSSTICWNIFQPLDGQRAVNGGEYCVRPMQPPYQPREVFSVCDIQYINEVHNCPQASLELDKRCPASGSSMTTSPSPTVFSRLQKTTFAPPTLPSPQSIKCLGNLMLAMKSTFQSFGLGQV